MRSAADAKKLFLWSEVLVHNSDLITNLQPSHIAKLINTNIKRNIKKKHNFARLNIKIKSDNKINTRDKKNI